MTVKSNPQGERIAVLETHFETLRNDLNEMARINEERHLDMSKKLDDILGLKHKGMGAFWLASSLVGVGIVGALGTMFTKWKELLVWLGS